MLKGRNRSGRLGRCRAPRWTGWMRRCCTPMASGFWALATAATGPIPHEEQAVLRGALGRWPGEDVSAALRVVQAAHVEVLARL